MEELRVSYVKLLEIFGKIAKIFNNVCDVAYWNAIAMDCLQIQSSVALSTFSALFHNIVGIYREFLFELSKSSVVIFCIA